MKSAPKTSFPLPAYLSLIAPIALLFSTGGNVYAQATTQNLFNGSLSLSSGAQLYRSPTQIDQKLGISANGTMVTQNGAPYPGSCYQRYLWNGPLYNERTNPANGQREAYILAVNGGGDVRTEGMGWALMLAVQANDQYRFNLLRNFVANHMRQNPYGYYNWHTDANGNLINGDNGCAPDGDTWITTALIMAEHRWPGNGYINEAWGNLWNMANNNPNSMFQPGSAIVYFGPQWGAYCTDPSYLNPAFYNIWFSATAYDNSNYSYWMSQNGGDAHCWQTCTNAARNYLNNSATITRYTAAGSYAFHPDQATFNGQPYGGSGYGFDAWRTTMHAALDATWNSLGNQYWHFNRDRQDYYYYQNPRSFSNGGVGELAMNAAAGECYNWSNGERADFAQQLWNAPPPGDYYNAYLYFLGMLITTGRFKAY